MRFYTRGEDNFFGINMLNSPLVSNALRMLIATDNSTLPVRHMVQKFEIPFIKQAPITNRTNCM